MLLDEVRIVLGRLPLVHRVEVDARVIGLDGLEERSESILETTSGQRSALQPPKQRNVLDGPLGIDLQWQGLLIILHSFLHE